MHKILFSALLIVANAFGQAAPKIIVSVDSPAAAVADVVGSTMSVSGTASGGTVITRVTWQTSAGLTGTASGTAKWAAAGIPVPEGNTTIVLRAYDANGSSAWVALVAVRQPNAVISRAAELPRPPAL